MHAWLVIRALIELGHRELSAGAVPLPQWEAQRSSLQLASTSALVEMHILHACSALHVAWRGSVELKPPMPGRHPCLASWLLGRTEEKVAACHVHVGQGCLLTKISRLWW